jgi:hypothetical protein
MIRPVTDDDVILVTIAVVALAFAIWLSARW